MIGPQLHISWADSIIFPMDWHANPLYPVPKLMNAKELEQLYNNAADWSEHHAD